MFRNSISLHTKQQKTGVLSSAIGWLLLKIDGCILLNTQGKSFVLFCVWLCKYKQKKLHKCSLDIMWHVVQSVLQMQCQVRIPFGYLHTQAPLPEQKDMLILGGKGVILWNHNWRNKVRRVCQSRLKGKSLKRLRHFTCMTFPLTSTVTELLISYSLEISFWLIGGHEKACSHVHSLFMITLNF